MKQALQIGHIFGIPIEVNYTWLIIFLLISWSLAIGYFPSFHPGLSQTLYWILSIISTLLLFLSLLLHELSHAFFAINNSVPIKKITLFIFGGVAQMEKEPENPSAELKIALAGPICSFILSIISFALSFILYQINANSMLIPVFVYLGFVNIAIVLFNSIPGFPLDGGRIFRAILWFFTKDLKNATRISTYFGKWFSYFLMTVGIIFLYKQEFLNGIWLILIGFFLHEASEMSYQQLILKRALVGIPVKDIMSKDVITVSPNLTLQETVNNYFFKYQHLGFPVVDNGVLKGIITLRDIKEFPQKDWGTTLVQQAMTPVRRDLIVNSNTDSLEALLQVTKSGLGRLLVVDNGKLSGIITQRSLLKMFEIKTNLCA